MEEKIVYLNAIYQNACTAMQSIEDIVTKTKDEALIKELCNEESEYSQISKECEKYAKRHKICDIKENNWFEKAKLWTSINMSTIFDKSTRKIAELMLLGTFMGIITCMKDKSDHKNVSDELDKIVEKLYELERKNIDKLLPFLTINEK